MKEIDRKKSRELLEAFQKDDTPTILEIIKANIPKKKKNAKPKKNKPPKKPKKEKLEADKEQWTTPNFALNINEANPFTGVTMMMYALKHQEGDLVKLLLSLKEHKQYFTPFNMLKVDKDGSNLLHYCARYKGAKYVPHVATRTTSPINDLNNLGFAPLHIAALEGDLECVQQLMGKKGVKVNVRTRIGVTPLMLAAANGHTEVVEYLISKGAKPELYDQIGRTADDYARDNYHLGVIG